MVKVTLDLSRISGAAEASIKVVADAVNTQAQANIRGAVWPWPRPTKRRNGSRVTSPRDIVDRGDLVRSNRVIPRGRGQWGLVWEARHALLVHEGFTLRSGTVYPGRPFARLAIDQTKPIALFAAEMGRRL